MVMQAAAPATPEHYRRLGFVESGRDDCLAVAPMTFEQYLALDQESGLVEWVDGEARLYMSNSLRHQVIITFLTTLVAMCCEVRGLGRVLAAGYAVALGGRAGREPDLVFVAKEHAHRLRDNRLDGPPDLVVEVVSPDSPMRDYDEKFREYEAAGVPEYWIIDARPGRTAASFFVLRDGRYVPVPVDGDGYYTSTALPGFRLQVDRLRDDEPAVMPALQEALAGAEAAAPARPAE